MKREEKYFCGCLLGGAVGDAFGAPVKFLKYEKILQIYGENGLEHLMKQEDTGKATITDDTQLTLFTAEGLLRSIARSEKKKIDRSKKDTVMVIFRSYLRWLYTQGLKTPNWSKEAYDGWLIKLKKLHFYREPGVTCLTSLGKGIMGTVEKPINDSNRCGTVIRVAPVGLLEQEDRVFDIGCMTGAITHGNPTAYLAAGALATIIHYIIEGCEIKEAVCKAVETLKKYPHHEECLSSIKKALVLASEGNPSVEKIHTFGGGFLANEALGMGIYAALSYPTDFTSAIKLAINQSGNSNSAAVITGNLLGAYLGVEGIEKDLIDSLELGKEIEEMGKDLYKQYEESVVWDLKYPGW